MVDLTEVEAENETRCHYDVNDLFLNAKDDWWINGGVKKSLSPYSRQTLTWPPQRDFSDS